MMGRTHALSGPVLALWALPLVNQGLVAIGQSEVSGWQLVPYAVAAAGGAMLPDLDHRHATVAQSLGPVTKGAAIAMETVSGGHRNGTHSVLGVIFFVMVTWGIAQWNQWSYGIWMAFLIAIASAAMFKQFRKGSVILHTVVTLVAGAALVWLSGTHFLPLAPIVAGVGIGTVAHILGDMLTKEGCPLFWPFFKKRFRFASLTTGQTGETVVFYILVALLPLGIAQSLGLLGPVVDAVRNALGAG